MALRNHGVAVLIGCLLGCSATGDHASSRASLAWEASGTLTTGRHRHTATLLQNGLVLIAGGRSGHAQGPSLSSTELFDPTTGSVRPGPPMLGARTDHAALLLHDGTVLVMGGFDTGLITRTERYDPRTNTWAVSGASQRGRSFATSTLLADGRVLVTGGWAVTSYFDNAEVYDPATGAWTLLNSTMSASRALATAVLLGNGRVMIIGGGGPAGALASCDIFDPATSSFRSLNPMITARYEATATLLPNGRVLVSGGEAGPGTTPIANAELFDPDSGLWTAVPSLAEPRALHSATLMTNGKVLVAGGYGLGGIFTSSRSTTEVFDPSTQTWSAGDPLVVGRQMQTATQLPTGEVLIAGGLAIGSPTTRLELHSPRAESLSLAASLGTARGSAATAVLADGNVLVTGGSNGLTVLDSAELFSSGSWAPTGNLNAPRQLHTATLLDSGGVLVAGGQGPVDALTSAELFDRALGTWTPVGRLAVARSGHRATALPNGTVLISGGSLASATGELYFPSQRAFRSTAAAATPRRFHSATLLKNGAVLIAGGEGPLSSAELFDPATATWRTAQSMSVARSAHTATLLPDGRVLVAGGASSPSAELYDPATNSWSMAGPPSTQRASHTAVLLQGGRVLVAGGRAGPLELASTEVYEPTRNTWFAGPAMSVARAGATADSLANGTVLLAGGFSASAVPLDAVERYDEGRAAAPGWAPSMACRARAAPGALLPLTGVRFSGLSEGSHGGHQQSPTNYPVGVLELVGNGATSSLPISTWTASGAQASVPATAPAGWHRVRVIVNGIPSLSQPLFVQKSLGDDCSGGDECSSGNCADGVCCDRACNGGPCEACSTRRGAATDGTCTFAGPAIVCRAQADLCDVADRCPGNSALCAADQSAPDGSQCDGGACSAGACVPDAIPDAGVFDAGVFDAGVFDAGVDAGVDGGTVDAGMDAGFDAGPRPEADAGFTTAMRGGGCSCTTLPASTALWLVLCLLAVRPLRRPRSARASAS